MPFVRYRKLPCALSLVEKMYSVEIDTEYAQDKCEAFPICYPEWINGFSFSMIGNIPLDTHISSRSGTIPSSKSWARFFRTELFLCFRNTSARITKKTDWCWETIKRLTTVHRCQKCQLRRAVWRCRNWSGWDEQLWDKQRGILQIWKYSCNAQVRR